MNKIIVVCAVSLGVGLSTGWALHSSAPLNLPSMAAQPAAPTAAAPVGQLAPASLDLSAMRALLREELAQAADGRRTDAQTATTRPENPPSAQTLARREEAVQAIDGMVAKSVWDADLRRSFEQNLMLLDPTQREHALQQLATGINSGAIRIHFDPRPPS